MPKKIQTFFLHKISCAALFCILCLQASAQDTLQSASYNFEGNGKYSTYKGAKYSLKGKDGKLLVNQNGKEEEIYNFRVLNIYDNSIYFNIDEKFDFQFTEAEGQSGVGLSVYTQEKTDIDIYFSITKFILTQDGKFKYFSGPLENNEDPVFEPAEICTSYKPGEVNQVQLIRNSHDWYLIVNGVMIKHSYEKRVAPFINLFSTVFLFEGKCKAEIDNYNFNIIKDRKLDNNGRPYTGVLQDMPVSECFENQTPYVNKEYGFTLCLDAKETTEDLSFSKYNYQYLKDYVSINSYSDLPFYVYPIEFGSEKDSLAVYKKFEEEFFDRISSLNIVSKEIYMDRYTPQSSTSTHGSYFRGYTIILPDDKGEAHVCFEYLHEGNSRFDALCFAFLSPTELAGAVYSLRNSAMLLQTVVLQYE